MTSYADTKQRPELTVYCRDDSDIITVEDRYGVKRSFRGLFERDFMRGKPVKCIDGKYVTMLRGLEALRYRQLKEQEPK